MAAITGTRSLSICKLRSVPSFPQTRASAAESVAISEISAPAMKAFWQPVMTTTKRSRSSSTARNTAQSSCRKDVLSALSFAAFSMVMTAICPCFFSVTRPIVIPPSKNQYQRVSAKAPWVVPRSFCCYAASLAGSQRTICGNTVHRIVTNTIMIIKGITPR